jgi:hypothetical protein
VRCVLYPAKKTKLLPKQPLASQNFTIEDSGVPFGDINFQNLDSRAAFGHTEVKIAGFRSKIKSALDMQGELEELFQSAKAKGDIRQAAYVSQVWASLESHAAKERERLTEDRTSIDDLVDIMRDWRKDYLEKEQEKGDIENEE